MSGTRPMIKGNRKRSKRRASGTFRNRIGCFRMLTRPKGLITGNRVWAITREERMVATILKGREISSLWISDRSVIISMIRIGVGTKRHTELSDGFWISLIKSYILKLPV